MDSMNERSAADELAAAEAELELQNKYSYVVVNNVLDDAVRDVKNIIERKDSL